MDWAVAVGLPPETGHLTVGEEGVPRQVRGPKSEERMDRRRTEERKTWLYNLPLGGQRARITAIRRLRDAEFPLTEEQELDLEYLRELLQ